MKCLYLILCSLLGCSCLAQPGHDFASIDEAVQFVEAPTPDSLAKKLTGSYTTELEKVRAIFSWITQHIAYNTGRFNRRYISPFPNEKEDTSTVWKSADEMTAIRVLNRRVAVCDGYAKLFKTLCDYSGVQAVVITGYARSFLEKGARFRSNHSWNAVMIDSSWYLVDPTWASGYIDPDNDFVARADDRYFLSDPRQFFFDHFPEDMRWTLLSQAPPMREFKFAPYKCKAFVKYGIQTLSPSDGMIEAAPGDTIRISFDVRDEAYNKNISADPFFDSTMLDHSPGSVFLVPLHSGKKVSYEYVVSPGIEWIDLMYNDDLVLRYRLQLKKAIPDLSTASAR